MRFKLRCRPISRTDEGWWEEYDKPITDAEAWSRNIIKEYNEGLRGNEVARELLEVVVLDARKNTSTHVWRKTNGFTVTGRSGSYDTFRCEHCGITGKRHGLGAEPKRDTQFKAKRYADCERARAYLTASGKLRTPSLATK